MTVNGLEERATTLKTSCINSARKREVTHLERLIRCRVTAHGKRSIHGTEVSRSRKLIWNVWNANVSRKILARSELVRDHGTETRELNRRAWTITSEHVMSATLVS